MHRKLTAAGSAAKSSTCFLQGRGSVTIVVSLEAKAGLEFWLIWVPLCSSGYQFCHSCSDYQALMPRTSDTSGYDVMPVCGFCIEYLTGMCLWPKWDEHRPDRFISYRWG